jgi:hypothetical protein
MRRVLILTPTLDGKLDCRYVFSLIETLKAAPKDVSVDFLFIAHDALIQRARNDLFVSGLRSGADDLVFIDSDQTWDPAAFYALLRREVDVVGYPYPKKCDVETYCVNCTTHKLEIKDGLMQIDGLGTGFLRITKKAAQHVWDKAEKYVENGIEKRMVFNVTVENGVLFGEDISFCKLLSPFDIWLDTTYTVPHIGHKVYVGKFDAWLEKIKGD